MFKIVIERYKMMPIAMKVKIRMNIEKYPIALMFLK